MSKILKLNLQLFAEGGAAAAGATAGDSAADNSLATNKTDSPVSVVYGKQTNEPNQTTVTDSQDNSTSEKTIKEEFDELIGGRFKEEFGARVKNAVSDRVKNLKGVEKQLNATRPIVEMLANRYGIDPTDINAISLALEEDNSLYEQEALEKGVSVEYLKEVKKLQRENSMYKQAEAQRNADMAYANWMREAEQLKGIYGGFNLEAELNNPEFMQIMSVPGMKLRTAYEIIHKDEIIPAAMQFATQKAQENLVNDIIARGARPTENGVSSSGAVVTKTDPSQLTSKDLAEIRKRVERGEIISF